jgi:Fe-S cluster assembly ATPase SufC
VFVGKAFLCEVSEKDILLFAMMAPVSVILDEIDGNIDENRIWFLLSAHLLQLLFE